MDGLISQPEEMDVLGLSQITLRIEANRNQKLKQMEKNYQQLEDRKCSYCGKLNHLEKDCSTRRRTLQGQKTLQDQRNNDKKSQEPKEDKQILCYRCGEEGHYASDCQMERVIKMLTVCEDKEPSVMQPVKVAVHNFERHSLIKCRSPIFFSAIFFKIADYERRRSATSRRGPRLKFCEK